NAEISTELIDVSLVNIDDKINQALQKIGKITKANRSFLFLFKNNITSADNTHEWSAPGVKPLIKEMKDLHVSPSSWWMKKLTAREHILISNLNNETNLPPRDREMLLTNNVVSLLTVPVFKGDEILGFLGLNSSDKKFEWNDFHTQIIKTISNSIANAISSVRNQNQLIIAKEKAEESDRLKSAFLANMSHEIRTPMNGIVGFLDLMQNANVSAKERKMYIQMVKKSGDRLLSTISDIIEISKIESGQTPVIRTVESITEIMDYLVNTFQPQAESKGLKFKLSENSKKLLNKPVSLKTDKIKLEIILKNLIGNAIKFTSEGGVELGYTLTHNSITFCVKDTGPGIEQEKLDIIFDRFVQADLDITRPYEGAGLGLSITRAYAEMLHGDIEVKSEPGKGSEFYFTLNHDSLVENKLS
ncbi:MAG TPA: ATP-binding protein, partial [Prolixibacteraceae bacterium]|nr:ATP-binding protein [Prolixibacteraceae bacterium]